MNGHVRRQHIHAASLILLFTYTVSWPFSLGVENLSHPNSKALFPSGKHAPSIGLICNQTACDQAGNRTLDLLRKKGVRIACVLAPEHGFDGKVQAGNVVQNGVDEKTGVSIVSIYGAGGDKTITGKRINPDVMRRIDALVYDVQDSGMRHYTYISTLLCALEAAAEHKKPLYVLDRPNFLAHHMEGPLVEPDLKSFISIAPIPLRHGMTVAELARYFNTHILQHPAPLHYIPMKNYSRVMRAPFLQALSPNLSHEQSVYGYSFLGILGEVQPFHIGVGTPDAFRIITLPDTVSFAKKEWYALGRMLRTYGIACKTIAVSKRGMPYSGVHLTFQKGAKFASFELLLSILSFFKERGVRFVFSATFDKAVGTKTIREWCGGSCIYDQLIACVRNDLNTFYKKAEQCFLYKPHPKIRT